MQATTLCTMKICLLGLDNLPVLTRQYRQLPIGGESVQQTLLALALARRGHDVSMVVRDHGQADGARCNGIRVFKAYADGDGLPVLRFIHPRWTGLWSALARADADLYYTSCAGMQVGLLALLCSRLRRRCVFRTASDSDCEPARLLVRYARDRWLYAMGLRRCDAILVQSQTQAQALARHYGLPSRVAGMLVEPAAAAATRDIDVLWVANVRQLKRPDRVLAIARALPEVAVHLVGGPLAGERALFDAVVQAAAALPNVRLHGRLSYWETNDLYARAKLLVNSSDVEGFPNAYLQAWARGVPVVTLIDPDQVIARQGLGVAVGRPQDLSSAVRQLLGDPSALQAASARCRAFIEREFNEDTVIAPYLETFESVLRGDAARPGARAAGTGVSQRHA